MNYFDILLARKLKGGGGGSSYELKTASGDIISIPNGVALPMPSLTVGIEAVQDLHGYDNPWAGGSGKNKLQVIATSQTIAGVTITVKDDGTFIANGTATQDISLQLSRKSVNDTPLPQGELIMNGCPSGGSTSSYYLTCWRTNSGNANDTGEGKQFSYQSDWDFAVSLVITNGTTCNNLIFKPMIRLASEQDATFEPYSNICPISGWSAVNRYRTGKNFYNPSFTRESGYYDDNGVLQTSNTTGHTQLTPVNSNTEYYFSIHARSNGGGKFAVYFWDSNRNWISRASKDYSSDFDDNNIVFTTPNNCRFISFQVPIGTSVTSLEFDESLTMICLNSLGTDFVSYNGTTYTTTLKDGQGNPLTCYGGELVNENGVQRLAVTHGYIASYNGETLPSTWISDRDVYAEGTTPTTGAEVVYTLATPQQIPQDNLAIATQEGTNNIWADSGTINECKYFVRV